MKLLSQLFSETPISLCGILQVVIVRHSLRDTSYVKPFESGATLEVKDLQREIMLFSDVNGNFAIVGPFR